MPINALPVLDDIDRRILTILQTDASQTNAQLAAQVHVSPPTCLRRVKTMTDSGVIQRQVAIVAPDKVGASLSAIVEITLDVQAAERMAEFEKLADTEAAVLQCYRVSPDMPAYHELAHRLFTAHANVRNVKTYFATHRSKFETRIAV
jgi:Lrp/AsnC family leucine-responsive transcriptional regulator